jgi:hypothetical protein
MTKKKLEVELSKTDFLHALLIKIIDFYNLNKRVAISVISGVIIVLLIFTVLFSYNYYYEKNAWTQYQKIETPADTLTSSVKMSRL